MSNKTFNAFAEELFNTYLEMKPQLGTDLGLHQYDGKISEVTLKSIEGNISKLKALYKKLLNINKDELTDINKYDYELAKWGIESELFDAEYIKPYTNNPMYYASMFGVIDNYVNREYAPFDDRLRSVISIISKVPEVLRTAEKNLKNTLPAVLCSYAKKFSLGYEDFFKGELLNVINERAKGSDLVTEYIEKSDKAIEAFEKYVKYIEGISSSTDENYRIGKNNFEMMLTVKEQIDIPVEELKKMGQEELKRLKNEMNKVLKENKYEGRLESLEHYHPTEHSLISDTKNMLDDLVSFIRQRDLVNLPERLNCIVTEMPKYASYGFAAMGTAGPFEKSDESYYYINMPEEDWDDKKKEEWLMQFNYPSLKLISIHEAYPGHYTHFLNANKYSTKLSKLFMSYSYVEGWAHYTEEMMIDQGYGKEDFKNKIGMLIEALIRCCRFIVSIGIHCENMTIAEAKKYFIKNAFMSDINALQEAERGAFDPGYLNYTLGKIFLKDFRSKYFDKYKEKRTLKDFHNSIVSLGAPTYRIAGMFILD